ncbi:hypothetical protein GN958_ATG17688 [Phytophthora infestans]|uniref:Uncharacterized protein n=1 Tax=Phytophthora infestans TaxID=4787 RepID=A0A8S9U2L8_PHYIN|nr:hypothetical protein GN958_ATG17688 [Phytophthora infestans]
MAAIGVATADLTGGVVGAAVHAPVPSLYTAMVAQRIRRRSVAERGGYAVSSGCTSGAGTGSSKQTTETSEETETFCRGYHYGNGHRDDHDGGNGKRRRHVAERGGYAVSSGCTSGAGTGSSKPTTETSEETETFCRGYHYGNGHRGDHDGGDSMTSEDVSGDKKLASGLAMAAIGVATADLTGGVVGAAVHAPVPSLYTAMVAQRIRRRSSVAERGGYAVPSGCTSGAGTGSSKQTTETSEETETFLASEDVRALAREDVSGDVTRSVAERGGYAVSSGCTSGAGTGSSKQTTETSEETETFCRGYHYGNGHRGDHDGGDPYDVGECFWR